MLTLKSVLLLPNKKSVLLLPNKSLSFEVIPVGHQNCILVSMSENSLNC